MAPFAVFSDFDGTITDVDTFNVLVRSVAGDAEWDAIDGELIAGRITLRETLRREAELVRLTRLEALAMLEEHARIDPQFPRFVERVRAEGGTITIVSAGIKSIILEALRRAGVDDVPVIANDVDYHHAGWRMTFVDDSVFGHDKSACVRAAHDAGFETVYCGDGISDFSAIALADRAFVRAGSSLVRYCTEQQIAFTPFRAFHEVESALFD